jgi:menaquinone-9 beta-reductase
VSTLRTDVLVIGGGPAGSVAAFQLATAGIGVTLVDRATFPRDKTCGESLSPGAMARLRAIGMWRPGAETDGGGPASGRSIRGMRVRSPRGTVFSGRYRAGPNAPGLAIRRTVLDLQLLDSARGRGVRVMEGVAAIAAEPNRDGGALVRCRAEGFGGILGIEARRVIVADGRQSFLARALGFIEPGEREPDKRRYAVRAHCDGVSSLSDLAEMHVGEGGYCGIAPLSNTTANICYVRFAGRLDMAPRSLEADFRRDVSAYPEISRRIESARIDGRIRIVGPLRMRSRRQVRGPFIACGDTTGFLDPFTGEGIAHAIASGVLGADAVRASLDGNADSFRDYERAVRDLRRIKGVAALLLYGLVSRRALANAAASVFSRMPRLGDAVVQLFGDQV